MRDWDEGIRPGHGKWPIVIVIAKKIAKTPTRDIRGSTPTVLNTFDRI